MLLSPYLSRHAFVVDNYPATPVAGGAGTSVTPGASNAEGAWTQVLAALGNDVYGFFLQVTAGSTSGAAKPQLLDVGVDPAGGTAYTAVISNIVCGASATSSAPSSGHCFFFPFFIRAGSTVAVRIQGANATAGTVNVGIRAYGKRSRQEAMPVGTYSETLGTITNSNGVSFTPGNAADGTWVSLGTTSRRLWWWQIGYQIDNGTITSEGTYVEIGFGDATNKHVICRVFHVGVTTEAITNVAPAHITPYEAYCPVPAGAELWIRGRCQNAPDSGYNGVAVGIGG